MTMNDRDSCGHLSKTCKKSMSDYQYWAFLSRRSDGKREPTVRWVIAEGRHHGRKSRRRQVTDV